MHFAIQRRNYTMKKFLVLLLGAVIAATLAVSACAASVKTLTVITATSTSTTKLSSLPISEEGLFCGWFTTSSAAKTLDTAKAASDGYAGKVYGAVVPFTDEQLDVSGVQIRTTEPYGLRFVAKADKAFCSSRNCGKEYE